MVDRYQLKSGAVDELARQLQLSAQESFLELAEAARQAQVYLSELALADVGEGFPGELAERLARSLRGANLIECALTRED